MKSSSGSSVAYGNDYSRFLQDRMKLLEGENNLLKEKLGKIEREWRDHQDIRVRYERELRKLKSELEKLRTPPLIVGTVVNKLDDKRMVIQSSTGPKFVVTYSKFLNAGEAIPGAQVGLNQQSLAVVSLLPTAKDPSVHGMEVLESPDVDYNMIGGLTEQIEEIREVVELPLISPERFERIGVEPPKGILLTGLPGTGKTLLAKAVAKRTSATFIRIVGSELVQKYIGEGARIVRELFLLAKEKAPSILFIDDGTSGEREVQRTMLQLLAEIDGFNPRGNVRILAATNRPDILDAALLRPGRFDRIIETPLPDVDARKEIFGIHTSKMKLKKNVDLDNLAALTESTSGADIRAIATEAGMLAVKENKKAIGMEEFDVAIKKVLGAEHRNCVNLKEQGVMFA
jgi:proteasome regulatory subunit